MEVIQKFLCTSRITHYCLDQWIHVPMLGIKHGVEFLNLATEELA
jgi:hypothetical protein